MDRQYTTLATALSAVLLTGCAAMGDGMPADRAYSGAKAPEPVPQPVQSALLPPLTVTAGRSTVRLDPYQRRYDINVKQTPAAAFFAALVDDTPYNMVVDPKVSGRITLNLKDVTIPEVMESAREAYGYEYRLSGNRFLVMPQGMQTRVFQLNYLNLRRQGISRTRVSSGQITDSEGSGDSASDAGGSGDDSSVSSVSGSQIDTDSSSDFWRELESTLKVLVPAKGDRRVVLSPESSLIVIRAMPDELRDVERYLQTVQSNMDRQVVLEAKILEVELNDQFQAGINWGALNASSTDTVFGGVVGGGEAIDAGQSAIADSALLIQPGLAPAISGFASTAVGGAFVLAVDTPDFSAVIELLENQGDVQVLSSPRVSTVNNQKAVIKVGSDEFFVTGVTSDTTTGAATNTSQEIELTPFFSGIALDVTPQISPTGGVTLHVHPTVSEVRDQTKSLVINGTTETLPLALSNIREADSIVRARSGQVIVIGGLMEDSRRDERLSTPFLGRIPIIGGLFRQTRQSRVKNELVILLKPLVVEDDASWDEAVGDSHSRFDSIGAFSRSGDGDAR